MKYIHNFFSTFCYLKKNCKTIARILTSECHDTIATVIRVLKNVENSYSVSIFDFEQVNAG